MSPSSHSPGPDGRDGSSAQVIRASKGEPQGAMISAVHAAAEPPRGSVAEVARFFAWLSLVGFGGPAAHLAVMRRELVERRGWLTSQEFLDLLGATQLIPGPNSTEMAIHIGYRRAGLRGLLAGGLCFIVPASLITLLLSWLYVRYGRVPKAQPMLLGIQASVVAVVALAAWSLGRTALRSRGLWLLGALAFMASLCGVPELVIFFGGGLLYLLCASWLEPALRRRLAAPSQAPSFFFSLGGLGLFDTLPAAPPAALPSAATLVSLSSLAWFFLKVGSVIYGSGYVLVALLLRGLVEERGWLPRTMLLDAVAIGQVTPGPVFTTATCVGYLLRGSLGALVATTAIFAPSFALVWGLDKLLVRLRHSARLRVFLDGVNACSLALLAATAGGLLASFLQRGAYLWLGFGLGALVLGIVAQINPSWLIVAGALAGLLLG